MGTQVETSDEMARRLQVVGILALGLKRFLKQTKTSSISDGNHPRTCLDLSAEKPLSVSQHEPR
jgi:hypothetical protein